MERSPIAIDDNVALCRATYAACRAYYPLTEEPEAIDLAFLECVLGFIPEELKTPIVLGSYLLKVGYNPEAAGVIAADLWKQVQPG